MSSYIGGMLFKSGKNAWNMAASLVWNASWVCFFLETSENKRQYNKMFVTTKGTFTKQYFEIWQAMKHFLLSTYYEITLVIYHAIKAQRETQYWGISSSDLFKPWKVKLFSQIWNVQRKSNCTKKQCRPNERCQVKVIWSEPEARPWHQNSKRRMMMWTHRMSAFSVIISPSSHCARAPRWDILPYFKPSVYLYW